MEEIWKDIKFIDTDGKEYDYSSLYQVSNYGRVKSLGNDKERKERILKQSYNSSGYLYVRLSKECKVKNFTIHRLVATMFIPNPDNLPIVNHISEVKSENFVWNLEWCDAKYNANYGTRNERQSEKMKGKFSGDKNPMYGRTSEKNPRARKVICLETKQIFGCAKDAEEWCGKGRVGTCCRGGSKTAGGYHWMFYEDYKRQLRLNTDINNSRLAA